LRLRSAARILAIITALTTVGTQLATKFGIVGIALGG